MWKPVSKLAYRPLAARGQVLVVVCPLTLRGEEVRARWAMRACAMIHDAPEVVRDVVRDLLANPQVRAVVFDGAARGRAAYDTFWRGSDDPGWGIEMEHITLVRRFVDLYDDDLGMKGPMQPFWPARINYPDDKEKRCG